VVEGDGEGEARFLADDLGEREPALTQLAAAAVSGLPPAGPELRRKPLTVLLPTADGPKVVRPLCVEDGGFSLHAATRQVLMRRGLHIDVETCPKCREKLKLIALALVQNPEGIARYLRHLGLPTSSHRHGQRDRRQTSDPLAT
jgi:hypothetical protein